ncbi:MAG: hypothetical protein HDS36_02370 [Bacteroides sp.]|nr:hypothetical protein [Bacteroides sp.]
MERVTDKDPRAFFVNNLTPTKGSGGTVSKMPELTKSEVENAVSSAFISQFPNLKFQSNIHIIKRDPDGLLGFNPIPNDAFHGEGTYYMDGWVTVFGKVDDDFMKTYQCNFNVEVKVEVQEGNICVSFKQPISLKIR